MGTANRMVGLPNHTIRYLLQLCRKKQTPPAIRTFTLNVFPSGPLHLYLRDLFYLQTTSEYTPIMGLRKTASLIIYRFRERGLEVFLTQQSDEWGLPGGDVKMSSDQEYIELEPSEDREEAVAIEGDWHEIPSLKEMLYEESGELKERLKEIEQGAFVSIKDALKERLSAGQVEFLRELRDVIADRNSVRDL